tara:strand:- start:5766 stop:6269 length:504 start_codon:yes stop_codon:yes gene_type:complete
MATITIPTENYEKGRAGSGAVSRHNGSIVAKTLDGLTIEEVRSICAAMTGQTVEALEARYEKLNVGMQRMNMGNLIKGAIGKIERENAKIAKKNEAIETHNAGVEDGSVEGELKDLHELPASGEDKLIEVSADFVEARDARIAKAEEEKAAKAKEREEKAKAKAEDA